MTFDFELNKSSLDSRPFESIYRRARVSAGSEGEQDDPGQLAVFQRGHKGPCKRGRRPLRDERTGTEENKLTG